jgi:hypothetical protein
MNGRGYPSERRFCSSWQCENQPCGPPNPLIRWVSAFFSVEGYIGGGVKLTDLRCREVKDAWIHASTSTLVFMASYIGTSPCNRKLLSEIQRFRGTLGKINYVHFTWLFQWRDNWYWYVRDVIQTIASVCILSDIFAQIWQFSVFIEQTARVYKGHDILFQTSSSLACWSVLRPSASVSGKRVRN